jgi:peptide/nickel transport system permease protein
LVIFIAIAGPSLAPRDPTEENVIIQVGDEWHVPPFDALTVPGFPLGSDFFGRDLLSRVLWGIRPTLTMVAVVAAVRLILGVAIGMSAGWSTGKIGRGLDAAISAALSVPALMVALGVIAFVGVEQGLWAFIVGLSLTGWVESARFVREQTQLIKGELYIEAARALGASDHFIVLKHILRQLMPMTWMLFSFEISSTLMTVAGLGFLGYYIGGDIWLEVGDFVARRVSGTPELGQMLATSWSESQVITQPWAMLLVGSVVFVAVLGFNMLGEGLRLRLSLNMLRRRTILQRAQDALYAHVVSPIEKWGQEKGWLPAPDQSDHWLRETGFARPALTGLALLVVGGGLLLWRAQVAKTAPEAQMPDFAVPGGHFWAAERHDAQGTLFSTASGPSDPGIQWIFYDPAGFAGGPAISAEGTLYIASQEGTLYALDEEGNLLWQTALQAGAVGVPALGADGTLYVSDKENGLTALTPQGAIEWRLPGSQGKVPSGGKATTGPVVASDGVIYYPGGNHLQAVSPTGEPLWQARTPYGFDPSPPLLNPTEELVFFLDAAFQTQDGTQIDLSELTGRKSNEQFVMGANGQTYYRSERDMVQWRLSEAGQIEIVQGLSKQIPGVPRDAGLTRDGVVWTVYVGGATTLVDPGVLWWSVVDEQMVSQASHYQSPVYVIAAGADATLYLCGREARRNNDAVECEAFSPGDEEPLWRVSLENAAPPIGGALATEKLYVVTKQGFFYAIGPQQDGPPTLIEAAP